MQKHDARSEGKAGVAEVENRVVPVGEEKRLKGNHLPPEMGCYFFVKNNIDIFITRGFRYI
jgi:hypothetical protein